MAPEGLMSDLHGPGGWRARTVRASWSSVALALVTLVAVFVGRNLFIAASQPIGWVAAAVATAVVIAPVIELQARWLPRALAIILSLIVAALVTVTIGAGVFLEVQDQLGDLQDRLPAAAERLERRSGPDSVVAQIELAALVGDVVEQVSERVSPEPSIEGAVGTVPAFLVSGVLVIFFLVWGDELFEGLERQISHAERRRIGREGLDHAVRVTQGYVLSVCMLGAAVALAGAGLAMWADLPTPLVLGVVLGAASVIPYFGVLFGSVPLLLLSAGFEPQRTTVTLIAAVIILQVLVTIATKAVERRSMRVGPAVIVIAALVGSDLYGVGGALVAVVGAILVVALADAIAVEQPASLPASGR